MGAQEVMGEIAFYAKVDHPTAFWALAPPRVGLEGVVADPFPGWECVLQYIISGPGAPQGGSAGGESPPPKKK